MSNPSRIRPSEWGLFCLLAAVFLAFWFRLGYPQFSAIDLSVDKRQAAENARNFLSSRGVDHRRYLQSVIFESDGWADTYLQKTLGMEREEDFMRENAYEIFSWKIRFFRQFEKEEYIVEVSPRTGKVVSFEHKIPEVEERPTPPKQEAQGRALAFLEANGLDFSAWDFHEEKAKKFDGRTEYSFSWEKKGVYIPWEKGEGGGKLITRLVISGDEIRMFSFNQLDLPENFYRYLDRQMFFGEYISTFVQLLFLALIVFSIAATVGRRHDVSLRSVRPRILKAAVFLGAVQFLSVANDLQTVLYAYKTSASLLSYLGIYFLQSLMGVFFIGLIFAAPAIAGESLVPETFPELRKRSLTHYFLSSFLNRSVARLIVAGYLFFAVMLGFQSVLFFFGQKYLGVWKQWIKLTEFSASYLPFFGAFAVGVLASFTEEAVFRVFGIPWLKKLVRSTVGAVMISALIWGFGHTQYAIFPVWFRGIEVTCIGLLYGVVFLRYGVIPLITAHFLFDVFWGVSPFILGKSAFPMFAGSLAVLLLPLAFAVAAYARNAAEEERELLTLLDNVQRFNLGVLEAFVARERSFGKTDELLREELLRNRWDRFLVELALRKAEKER